MPRNEVTWDTDVPEPTTGTATPATAPDDLDEYPVAFLWLPDPGERRGWYGKRVARKPEKKDRPPLGYGR